MIKKLDQTVTPGLVGVINILNPPTHTHMRARTHTPLFNGFIIVPGNISLHWYLVKAANRMHGWIWPKQGCLLTMVLQFLFNFKCSRAHWAISFIYNQCVWHNIDPQPFPAFGPLSPGTNESCLSVECSSQVFLVFHKICLIFLIFLMTAGFESQNKELTALENDKWNLV